MKVKELDKMTRQELCDYCRAHKIKGYSGKTKQQRIDLILEHHGNVLVKKGFVREVSEQRIKEIEKDYQNLKQTSKAELWKIYSRSHRVISEDKQESKRGIIADILNDRYRKYELEQWNRESFKPKPKSKTKSKLVKPLKIYLHGSSIRSEGIGDVKYIVATTSISKAIKHIQKASTSYTPANWIRQRISDVDLDIDIIKKTNIKPLDNPSVLYMIETGKLEGDIISYRKVPILLKKWDSLGNEIRKKPISKPKHYDVSMSEEKEYDGSVEFYVYRGIVNGKKFKAIRYYGYTPMEHIDEGNLTKEEEEAVFKEMRTFG